MRAPDGGSVHDPSSQLPAPMWDRIEQAQKGPQCRGCSTSKNKVHKRVLCTSAGVVSVCWRCDGGVWSVKA